MQSRWGGEPRLTAASQLAELMDDEDLAEHFDPDNAPLSPEAESRVAWTGMVLQPMTQELARISNVSEQTEDGQTGAVVSYVFPNSPAEAAGVEAGWILLRLNVEDEPKPMDIRVGVYYWETEPFPWDQFDGAPVQVFERIPPPWPSAETPFLRSLTDLGYGRAYAAEFFVDGEIVSKDFEVVESPPHYYSAPRHTSDELGMTLKDLTFETRLYFRKAEDDPGVLIASIETGSLADVVELKPFEIITHVNDQPVHSAGEFAELIEGQSELRLDVMRMTVGRVVKIEMESEEPIEMDPGLQDDTVIDADPIDAPPAEEEQPAVP